MGKPNAYNMPSCVPRYTCEPPPESPPPCTNEAIDLPLFHKLLPVTPSSAYTTAGTERWALWAAVILASSVRNSPLDAAKTTPLIISGVRGATISGDVQAFSSDSVLPWIATFHDITALAVAARRYGEPAASCQFASAPGENLSPATSTSD